LKTFSKYNQNTLFAFKGVEPLAPGRDVMHQKLFEGICDWW